MPCILIWFLQRIIHTSPVPFSTFLFLHIVLSIHTEVSNSTNKLNHVKRSAVFQNKPFTCWDSIMNHLCCYWDKHILTIAEITFCNPHAQWLPLVDKRFIINKSIAVSITFFWTWCDKQCCQAWLCPSNGTMVLQMGVVFQRARCYWNQWSIALMEAVIMSKCKQRHSHYDFLNTVSKKDSNWVSLLKRNDLLAKVFFL